MARSKKSPKDTAKAEAAKDAVLDGADDATQIDIGDGAIETAEVDTDASDEASVDTDSSDESEPEAEISDEASAGDAIDDMADTRDEDTDDVIAEPEAEPAATLRAEPQVVVKKRGLVPMLLGGVICVGLGYAGANFIKPDGWPFPGTNTEVLKGRIAALESAIAEAQTQSEQLAGSIDAVRSEIVDVTASVDAKIADMDLSATMVPVEAALAAIDQRLTAVEAAPVAEAIVSPEATAAYERQLNEMQVLLDSEVARLQDAKEAAENEKAHAAKSSAVSRLQEAIATGQPYDTVLGDLDIEVPAALSASAATGVATLQEIATSFTASADITIVETAKVDADSQGWMDRFLRTQLGLRSLTPKDGATPDAILSRAEQAIRDNDLQTALTEISTLPDVGQAVMADWIATAQTRLDVTNALSALLAQ